MASTTEVVAYLAGSARSLTAPADVTELCLALEAARQQAGWPAARGRIPVL